MEPNHLPDQWGIAVAAVIMQICLGAVYGWSVFVKPLIARRPSKDQGGIPVGGSGDRLSGSQDLGLRQFERYFGRVSASVWANFQLITETA